MIVMGGKVSGRLITGRVGAIAIESVEKLSKTGRVSKEALKAHARRKLVPALRDIDESHAVGVKQLAKLRMELEFAKSDIGNARSDSVRKAAINIRNKLSWRAASVKGGLRALEKRKSRIERIIPTLHR